MRNAGKIGATIILAAMMIAAIPSMLAPATAQEQPSQEEIISSSFSGPAFLDAYWTDREPESEESTVTRKEVGPGEGAATLAVVLVNRGGSDITSVTGYLSTPSGFSPNGRSASGDAVAAHDQVVEAGQTFTLHFELDVSDNARVGSYVANLDVKYSRLTEMGGLRDAFISVPFRLTGNVILEPVTTTRTLEPGVTNDIDFEIRNLGTAAATGVTVSIIGITSATGDGSASSEGQVANFGTRTYTLGTIEAGESAPFTSDIFLTNAASGSLAGVNLEIEYNDAYGNSRTMTPSVGMVVQQSATSLVGVKAVGQGERSDNQIVAGKVDDLVLEISNKDDAPIESAVISFQPASESINILGDSKWAVPSIEPGAAVSLPTRVFAPSSLIGSSTSFNVSLDYLLEGESKSEQIVLGTYVDGEITIRIYDLAINYIGNTPNLVGNLLNEGNTDALFTTIEIVPSESGSQQLVASGPQQQYLGDLTENSPLPFSIPLSARGLEPGTYPVTLMLTYKDSLRNNHELVTSADVILEQSAIAGNEAAGPGQRPGGQAAVGGIIVPIVVAAAVGIGGFVFFKKRRTKAKKASAQEDEEDITAVLDGPGAEHSDPKGSG